MPTHKLIQGDCLTVLKSMPKESIDCVVTSPPYWALRDYQSTAIIFGGDKNCKHEFEVEKTKKLNLKQGNPEFERPWREQASNEQSSNGCFCVKCGAWKGQLGLEPTPDLFIKHLCDIFDEVKRVLKKTGTCWVNLGDTYSATRWSNSAGTSFMGKNDNNNIYSSVFEKESGLPDKCLCQIPSRFAIEMTNRGWILRNEIIWHKNNCMPASIKDRFTVDFEKIFFFVKNKKYFFEQQLEPLSKISLSDKRIDKGKIKYDGKRKDVGNEVQYGMCYINSKGRNKRCVWNINPKPYPESHFAVFPRELIKTPIKAGCPENGVVLGIFCGSGTTIEEVINQKKNSIGIELNPEYCDLIKKRIDRHVNQTDLFEKRIDFEFEVF